MVVVVVAADMASKSVADRTRFKELPEATRFILPNDMVRRILVSMDPGDGNDDDNNDVDEVVKDEVAVVWSCCFCNWTIRRKFQTIGPPRRVSPVSTRFEPSMTLPKIPPSVPPNPIKPNR